jgi:Gas vesicle synthesis protein GvpL/GvpF
MATAGNYLYGFTDGQFQAAPDLRGLAGAPLQALTYRDVAAIVSPHPVQRLVPSRRNLEPHHHIVRHISSVATLVPAAFGHISETEEEMLEVLRGNYDEIRQEISRLDRKCEMTIKLSWSVDNLFLYFVRRDRELRDMRDRAFRHREPSMPEKLEIGGRFEALLERDRSNCAAALVQAINGVASEVLTVPPRAEKTVCETAVLIERSAVAQFEAAAASAAALFDNNFTLDYSGPWPAYSFVRLRLQSADGPPAD